MSESTTAPTTTADPGDVLLATLRGYRARFTAAADAYDGSTRGAAELEEVMAGYSELVTDARHEVPFLALQRDAPLTADLVAGLRAQSARCAAVLEKYRALRLLEGRAGAVGYFAHVESCIAEEFGALAPDAGSSLLLVGSGSFPMTLLNVAEQTGAAVAGIDIDVESVRLARRVVEHVRGTLDVTLEARPAEELPFTREATHVVFSSTVPVKYELLHALHEQTRDDVVVAVRFGDGLKSLFNYPMQAVDPERWQLVTTLRRPGQVFDIALYRKARVAGGRS